MYLKLARPVFRASITERTKGGTEQCGKGKFLSRRGPFCHEGARSGMKGTYVMAAMLQSCRAAELQGCRLHGCRAAELLQSCRAAELQSCRAAELQGCRAAALQLG